MVKRPRLTKKIKTPLFIGVFIFSSFFCLSNPIDEFNSQSIKFPFVVDDIFFERLDITKKFDAKKFKEKYKGIGYEVWHEMPNKSRLEGYFSIGEFQNESGKTFIIYGHYSINNFLNTKEVLIFLNTIDNNKLESSMTIGMRSDDNNESGRINSSLTREGILTVYKQSINEIERIQIDSNILYIDEDFPNHINLNDLTIDFKPRFEKKQKVSLALINSSLIPFEQLPTIKSDSLNYNNYFFDYTALKNDKAVLFIVRVDEKFNKKVYAIELQGKSIVKEFLIGEITKGQYSTYLRLPIITRHDKYLEIMTEDIDGKRVSITID